MLHTVTCYSWDLLFHSIFKWSVVFWVVVDKYVQAWSAAFGFVSEGGASPIDTFTGDPDWALCICTYSGIKPNDSANHRACLVTLLIFLRACRGEASSILFPLLLWTFVVSLNGVSSAIKTVISCNSTVSSTSFCVITFWGAELGAQHFHWAQTFYMTAARDRIIIAFGICW